MTLLVVLDTETTGLDPDTNEIIQFACLTHKEGSDLVSTFETLLDPGMPIDPGASAINGITDDMVKGQPEPAALLQEWWDEVMDTAGDAQIVICAHNAPFDLKFLIKHIDISTIPVICTLQTARRKVPESSSHKLTHLYSEVLGLVGQYKAHDAMGDVWMCFEVLQQWTTDSYTGMAEWLSKPEKLEVMPFGKHHRRPFKEIPASYMRFMLGKPNMDVDVKYSMQCALQER